jgi:hypothetical protein
LANEDMEESQDDGYSSPMRDGNSIPSGGYAAANASGRGHHSHKSGKELSRAFSTKFVSNKDSMKEKEGKTEKALETKLQIEEEKNQDKTSFIEHIRLKTKRFLSSTFIGKAYTHTMLFLSVVSCVEFIYQTYLTPHWTFERRELRVLTVFEMTMSTMFGFDWLLSFFIADRKLAFFGRYVPFDQLSSVCFGSAFSLLRVQLLFDGGSADSDSHLGILL